MEQITINLSANNQNLTIDKILEITDDTVRYVHAVVDLGDNWEFDSIRAIWTNGISVSTVLNNGECDVPAEVLDHIGVVKVNLVGSDVENNELIDRLPTWQIPCILVKQDVPIDGTDPQPITPSEYEQFVQAVKDDADRAEQGASDAQSYATDASGYADDARGYAEDTQADKEAIEQAIAEVIQQIEDFEQVQVVVNTLPPSSQATSDFTDGVLTLGIPQGVKGDTGNGIQSIAKTGTSGLVDTYTITFTDGQTTTFTVTNGAKGDTGNGIQSIAKTSTVGLVDTYTITYTNGTTTTFTVTNGEKGDKGEQGDVSLAQLYAVYPTDTASGDIASFPDGADSVPMLSVVADIEPIQDLHGYDKPWSGGAGKNKWDFAHPQSTHYASVTENSDGTFYTAGTRAGAVLYYLVPVVANQPYTIKISTTGDSGNVSILGYSTVYDGSDTSATKLLDNVSTKTEKAFTPTGSVVYIVFKVTGGNGAGSANVVEPMIEAGAVRTAYAPYSNICPISGRTECVTERTGKNLLDPSKRQNTNFNIYFYRNDENGILLKANTTYTLSGSVASAQNQIIEIGGSRLATNYGKTSLSYTPTSDKRVHIDIYYTGSYVPPSGKTTADIDVQLEVGSTATSYEPYSGETYTTQFGQTVYGGSVDLVSGVLTVDRAMVTLDGSSDESWVAWKGCYAINGVLPAGTSFVPEITHFACNSYELIGAKSDPPIDMTNGQYLLNGWGTWNGNVSFKHDDLADLVNFKSIIANEPIQLVYELATPTTIQLTPQEIDSFKGANNLWASTGEIEVEYRADIGLYIEKKLS